MWVMGMDFKWVFGEDPLRSSHERKNLKAEKDSIVH